MKFQLDHVYWVCPPGAPNEVAALQNAGLTTEFEREHRGQGTANRLVLFPRHYIELIWISNAADAAQNAMGFPERVAASQHRVYGVCLRHPPECAALTKDLVEYHIDGFDTGHLRIHPESMRDITLPMIFALVFNDGSNPTPEDFGYPDRLLQHPSGVDGLSKVSLSGPGWGAFAHESFPDELTLSSHDQRTMTIELSHPGLGAPLDFENGVRIR